MFLVHLVALRLEVLHHLRRPPGRGPRPLKVRPAMTRRKSFTNCLLLSRLDTRPPGAGAAERSTPRVRTATLWHSPRPRARASPRASRAARPPCRRARQSRVRHHGVLGDLAVGVHLHHVLVEQQQPGLHIEPGPPPPLRVLSTQQIRCFGPSFRTTSPRSGLTRSRRLRPAGRGLRQRSRRGLRGRTM